METAISTQAGTNFVNFLFHSVWIFCCPDIFVYFKKRKIDKMAILAVLSIVISISALFISMGSIRDQEKLTDQISEILLERVKDLIKQDLQMNKKSVKRAKKND